MQVGRRLVCRPSIRWEHRVRLVTNDATIFWKRCRSWINLFDLATDLCLSQCTWPSKLLLGLNGFWWHCSGTIGYGRGWYRFGCSSRLSYTAINIDYVVINARNRLAPAQRPRVQMLLLRSTIGPLLRLFSAFHSPFEIPLFELWCLLLTLLLCCRGRILRVKMLRYGFPLLS